MTEAELEAGLVHHLEAIARLPPSPLGYKGHVVPFRLGVYAEGYDPNTNRIFVADPAEVALGRLAWREWVTIRAGKAGGSQAVQPGGGNPLGGVGVGGLISLMTGVPLATALGPMLPPDLTNGPAAQQALIEYLRDKARLR
jgi:hypothetical protein